MPRGQKCDVYTGEAYVRIEKPCLEARYNMHGGVYDMYGGGVYDMHEKPCLEARSGMLIQGRHKFGEPCLGDMYTHDNFTEATNPSHCGVSPI